MQSAFHRRSRTLISQGYRHPDKSGAGMTFHRESAETAYYLPLTFLYSLTISSTIFPNGLTAFTYSIAGPAHQTVL